MPESLFIKFVGLLLGTLLKPFNLAKTLRTPFYYRTPPGDCFWSISIWWWGSASSTLTFSLYKVIHSTCTSITEKRFLKKTLLFGQISCKLHCVNWCKTESKKNRIAFKLIAFLVKSAILFDAITAQNVQSHFKNLKNRHLLKDF